MESKATYHGFILCGTGLLLLALLGIVADGRHSGLLIKEGGLIETASASAYFLIAGYLLFKDGGTFIRKHGYFIVLVLLFGFRELDFDKHFTTMGIFKSRFYLNSDIPIAEKIFGGIVISCAIWVVHALIKNHFGSFLQGLKLFRAECIGALIVLGLIAISKTLDGIPRKLESLGLEGARQWTYQFAVFEEVLEFGIPVFMLLSFSMHFQKRPDVTAESQTA